MLSTWLPVLPWNGPRSVRVNTLTQVKRAPLVTRDHIHHCFLYMLTKLTKTILEKDNEVKVRSSRTHFYLHKEVDDWLMIYPIEYCTVLTIGSRFSKNFTPRWPIQYFFFQCYVNLRSKRYSTWETLWRL
jgi:hypothetical protein